MAMDVVALKALVDALQAANVNLTAQQAIKVARNLDESGWLLIDMRNEVECPPGDAPLPFVPAPVASDRPMEASESWHWPPKWITERLFAVDMTNVPPIATEITDIKTLRLKAFGPFTIVEATTPENALAIAKDPAGAGSVTCRFNDSPDGPGWGFTCLTNEIPF